MQLVQQMYCGGSRTTDDDDDDDDTSDSGNSNNNDNDNTITAVISCLASRSGIKSDAYRIDYQATLDCLNAAIQTQTSHFILLSAFCVQKPTLQFQQGMVLYTYLLPCLCLCVCVFMYICMYAYMYA